MTGRATIGVLTAAAAAALATAAGAHAHAGDPLVSPLAPAPPTIDGVLEPGEWDGALEVPFRDLNDATAYLMNDGANLYLALRFIDPDGGRTFSVYFDNEHDGVRSVGDDVWRLDTVDAGRDFWFNSDVWADDAVDQTAAAHGSSAGTGEVVFELAHPLCTRDGQDVCLTPDGVAGIKFLYHTAALGLFTFPAGTPLELETYADLQISAGGSEPPPPPSGETFVVNVADDGVDEDGCTRDHCSLREAIAAANASDGADTIAFAIPGEGGATIVLGGRLPDVSGPVTIDGTTQPGASEAPAVELDGSELTVFDPGLVLVAPGSSVRGLAFTGFRGTVLRLHGGDAVVEGNWIGHGRDGSPSSTLAAAGIGISSSGNRVGGTTAAARNVVARASIGIAVDPSADGAANVIAGNYVGTDPSGTSRSANGVGIRVQSGGVVIGGDEPGARNVVSGNAYGIEVVAFGADVSGVGIRRNLVGVAADGSSPLGNGNDGVRVEGLDGYLLDGVEIGGPESQLGNVIAHNGRGVSVLGSAAGVDVQANSIHSNTGLGIDLAPLDEVNANDAGDADDGPNGAQNFPEITSAAVGSGALRIQGSLSSAPLSAYRIDWYVSAACDDSGNGEGAIWAGRSVFPTNADGLATIDTEGGITFPATPGQVLTATATDKDGNTSEFSECVTVTGSAAAPVFVVNAADDDGDGTCTVLRCTLRDAILASGTTRAPATIAFAIGFGGPQTIQLSRALPPLQATVTIDGWTQPGAETHPPIELDGTGTGRGVDGLDVRGAGTTIRGLVVNRFPRWGIRIAADDVTVERSYLGTDATGSVARPNAAGVVVEGAAGATIRDNVVSGNAGPGVGVVNARQDGLYVFGNRIGVAADGTTPLGNVGSGVHVIGADVGAIGDDGSLLADYDIDGSPNTIAHNGGAGVFLDDTWGIRVVGNAIHSNGGLGIDLAPEGVNPNDVEDGDEGANLGQNFPELESVEIVDGAEGEVHVLATVDAHTDDVVYRVDYYASDECDPSGNGEGARHLGHDLTMSAGGSVEFDSDAVGPIAPGEVLTATVTDNRFNTSEFSACATVGGDVELTLALEAADTVEAGAARIRLADVPSWIALGRPADGPQAAPLANVPLANVPLANVDLRHSPLANVPLANVGLGDVMDGPLGDVALSAIPLSTPGGWEAVLAGTIYADVPLQTVTLRDVYSLSTLPPQLQPGSPSAVPLANVDLSHARLGSLPLAGVALAGLPLANVPLANVPLANVSVSDTLAAWCTALAGPPLHCTDPSSLLGETLLSTSVRGAPLANVPLANVPLANVPLANVPLANVPLANVPLANVPLANVADCSLVDCAAGTLGDAYAAGALHPDVTLGDVVGALGDLTLGDLHTFGDVTLADIWDHLPDWVTLGDVLVLLLGPAELPWESLDLDLLDPARYAAAGGGLAYDASFRLDGGGGVGRATLKVTLPAGFSYVDGTARLVASGGVETPLADPAASGQELAFELTGLTRGETYRLVVRSRPSIVLGLAEATAAGTPVGGSTTEAEPARTQVTDTFEPNDSPEDAPEIASDSLYLSYVTSAGDVDYYRFAVPPAGTRVVVRLSQLAADFDLAVYGPGRLGTPRDAAPGPPLDGVPLADDGAPFGAALRPLAPEALEDVPLLRDRPLWGLSINRGTEREDVVVVSDGEPGHYVIQVSGYNGARSARPYMLRVQESAPRVLPPCAARTFPHAGTPGTLPGSLPAGLNTVFLVNRQRLEATHGAPAAAQALDALDANLAALASLGFPAAVLPVEGDADVAAAYAAWDGSPCSPHAANAVVREIGELLDDVRSQRPGLRWVVLVGGDDVVPHARIDDVTTFANEIEYAGTFGSVNSQYLGAFGNGKLLTDDPYASTAPIPFFNRQLYVPDLEVGRLVETPAEIAGAIGRFVASAGRLDPETSFTTGYDFLSDGAQEIHDHLAQLVPGATSLINETWTSGDVESALLRPNAPGVASVNAHFDHHRALPAAPHAAGTEQDLFTIEQVRAAAPATLAERLLFTMGCHAGLSLADAVIASTEPGDWPQALAEQGALFAGNTGFGLGDTEVVGYTEKLLALFAEELRSAGSVAAALARAKHRYLAAQGVVGVYDEKVAAQMTLYGLPMYAVGDGTAPLAAASAPATAPDPLTGIEASSFAVSPQFTTVDGDTGDFERVQGGDFQVTHFRPIQPRLRLPAQPGARGALVTALASADLQDVDPAFSRPIVDSSEREPEISFGSVAFPTKIQTVTRGPDGESLVLVVGQLFDDGGSYVQRRWTQVSGLVYSSSSPDYVPPDLRRIDGVRLGGQVAFAVDAADAAGPVKRVYVLYRDGSVWRGVDLVHSGGSTFTGGGPVQNVVAGTEVEYFVQAVDAAGNVAVSTRKGEYYDAEPPEALDPELTVELGGTAGNGGWYRSAVTVSVGGPQGAALEVSVDGGAFAPYDGPFVVAGDGIHRVEVRGPGGLAGTALVPIDATPASVVVVTPAQGGVYRLGADVRADYACLDAGSGAAQCAGTVARGAAIDTSSAGTKSFSVTAADVAGNATAGATVSYVVSAPPRVTITCPSGPVKLGSAASASWTAADAGSGLVTPSSGTVPLDTSSVGTKTATTPPARDAYGAEATASCEYAVIFDFDGFLQPISNAPVVNVVTAGQSVPVKFGLKGDQGLGIFAQGFPRSVKIACDTGAPSDEVTETAPAGASLLQYDPVTGHYTYVWKTDKAWTKTCRRLEVKLVDGVTRSALFRFR